MIKALAYLFTFLMLFNTSSIAWSKTCTHAFYISEHVSIMDDSAVLMPCHQTENATLSEYDCDGACFCAAMSFSPTLYVQANHGFEFFLSIQKGIAAFGNELFSIHSAPAKRPPKYYS